MSSRSTSTRSIRRTRLLLVVVVAGVIVYVGYSLAYIGHNLNRDGSATFEEGFERPDLEDVSRYGALELCCAHSATFVADPLDTGKRALRIELAASDPDVRGSKRAELRFKSVPFRIDRWYGARLFIPPSWQDAPETVTVLQWHAVDDRFLGEGGRTPPLRLLVDGGQWRIVNHWDERLLTGLPVPRRISGGRSPAVERSDREGELDGLGRPGKMGQRRQRRTGNLAKRRARGPTLRAEYVQRSARAVLQGRTVRPGMEEGSARIRGRAPRPPPRPPAAERDAAARCP